MAITSLTDTQSRATFFKGIVLGNLGYWKDWVAEKMTDIAAIDHERNNLIKAISLGLKLEETWTLARELIVLLCPYMERRGHWQIWNLVLRQAIEAVKQRGEIAEEANLSALFARLLARQNRFKESAVYYRRAIRLSRHIGDPFSEARALSNLGYYYIENGHWYRAEILCCHALNIFEQIENDHGRAHTENHLGILYTRQGFWDRAEYHLEKACAIWQAMGDYHGLMYGYINLSMLFNETNQPDKTRSILETALALAEQTGDEVFTGKIYNNLGNAYRLKGQLALAETYICRAESIFRRFSDENGLAETWDNLGLICLEQQKWPEAIVHLNAALNAWRYLKNRYGELRVLTYMIEYDLAQGDPKRAETLLVELETILRRYDPNKRYRQLQQRLIAFRRSLTAASNQSAAANDDQDC